MRAPPTASSAAPGYAGLPAVTPTTPREYLWASGAGPATARSASDSAQAAGSRSRARRPMSTTVTDPARDRAGGTTRAGLSTPKHTVTSARTASPATCAGVGVHPAGHVDRHDRDTGREHGAHRAGGRLTNRTGTADAQDPVEDEVRGRDRRHRPPGRPRRSRGSPRPAPQRHRRRACAPGRRSRRSRTPRPARCARAHRASPPLFPEPTRATTRAPRTPAAAAAQEVEADPGQGRRGALHEHRLGHAGPGLGPPDHLDRTDRAHLHLRASCLPHGPDTRRRTTRTIRTTRHIGNVRHGPTRDRVGGRRIPPPPILPQPGRERGTQVPLGIPRATSP